VVVTGVPAKSYRLPAEWIQPNTVVVNVASFKNVDEEALLQIPGVIYIPQVGKVTVAMLERNLMRLFENFHHPKSILQERIEAQEKKAEPWYDRILKTYIAAAVTLLLALELSRRRK
jgi:hypothetical protein